MDYEIKTILGALVFEASNGGRYATATLMASNYKLRILGGYTNNTQQLGSDIEEDNLHAREAVGVVMMALGIPHNEDAWCEMLDTLQIHVAERVAYFERRISEI